jgi:type IX secretion system PorP/SprF family membrane protein
MRFTYLIYIIYAIVLTNTKLVLGQQDPQFSHYMFNHLYINPATAGVDKDWNDFMFIHRSQYAGYAATNDASQPPTTQLLSVSAPLTRYQSGVGVNMYSDRFGPVTTNQANLSYAYHYAIGEKWQLSAGIRGAWMSQTLDYDKLRWVADGDKYDAYKGSQSQSRPDFGAGIHLKHTRFYTGVSVSHLNKSGFNFGTNQNLTTLARHLYWNGGVRIDVASDWFVSPAFIVKSDLKSHSWEVGATTTYLEKFYVGLSYRSSDAVTILAGINLQKDNSIKLGYAFDYVLNGKAAKAVGSHELMLVYRLPAIKFASKSIIRTPRFRF